MGDALDRQALDDEVGARRGRSDKDVHRPELSSRPTPEGFDVHRRHRHPLTDPDPRT
ncbi:hypothetical protein ACFQV8_00885 [Pseudonocardia benzenivorans]